MNTHYFTPGTNLQQWWMQAAVTKPQKKKKKKEAPTYPNSWLEVSQLRELSPEPILRLLGGWLPSFDTSSITSSCRYVTKINRI